MKCKLYFKKSNRPLTRQKQTAAADKVAATKAAKKTTKKAIAKKAAKSEDESEETISGLVRQRSKRPLQYVQPTRLL